MFWFCIGLAIGLGIPAAIYGIIWHILMKNGC